MKNLTLFCSLLCIPLVGLEVAGGIGLRQDALRWTIGVTDGKPNIVSELAWKNIRSVNVELAASQILYRNIGLNGSVNYGKIFHGTVWDRDWRGQDKTRLFSISNSDANKGSLFDAEVEVKCYWPCGSGVLSESSGFGYHQLHLSMLKGWHTNYEQEIYHETMEDLNSSYKAQFYGPYLGLNYTLPISSLLLHLGYHYSFLQYRGKGHWNLRSDFSDDFIQECQKGFGHTLTIDSRYAWSDHFKFGLLIFGRYFKGYHGHDYTFGLEDGIEYTFKMDFNSVRWVNLSLYLYVAYEFGAVERRPNVRERLQRVFPKL